MTPSKASNFKSSIEIIGLIAVVLGLIFVGIEVRQNTAAVQAETLQGLNDSSQDFILLLASNPELIELQLKVEANPSSLSEIEERQFSTLERARWLRSQNAYFQHQRGTLGDSDWETYARLLCGRQQSFWPRHKPILAQEFVNFVESTCEWQ